MILLYGCLTVGKRMTVSVTVDRSTFCLGQLLVRDVPNVGGDSRTGTSA
jgi:hypothetical protein